MPTDGPEWEACAVCGTKPSYYREKWFHGMTERRRLGRRCYSAAVGREQAKVASLTGTVDLAAMERITASVGRCTLCRLATVAWAGDGVRLCEACYGRKMQRRVEQGSAVMTSTSHAGAADARP